MIKIAVFVEGQTEQLFAERLIEEIAGRNRVSIVKRRAVGKGIVGSRTLLTIEGERGTEARYYAVLIDCGCDNRVGSDIRDNYEKLVESGFSFIIGIRDVYPDFRLADVPKLRTHLNYKLRTVPIQVLFVLGVMEIEAWFLAEHTHFLKLSPLLTLPAIVSAVGFDPSQDDLTLRTHPAEDLNRIYTLAGLSYNKKRWRTLFTLDALDFEVIYLTLRSRIPDLHAFILHIENFLSVEVPRDLSSNN